VSGRRSSLCELGRLLDGNRVRTGEFGPGNECMLFNSLVVGRLGVVPSRGRCGHRLGWRGAHYSERNTPEVSSSHG
jgi:hypothetical protein